MKKTYNINIGGIVFTIDDDAYSLLNDYVDTLDRAFRKQPDGKEIVDDIESRIAELFQQKLESGKMVITLADTEEIIDRIGKPEEIIAINQEDSSEVDPATGDAYESEKISINEVNPNDYPDEKIKKRLFRDPQNGLLSGVCAGLAEYLNVDIAIIRILFVISVFISFSITAIIYIVLWIILPEVKTPYDRMQLTGQKPTIENIGKNVTDSFRNSENPSSNPKSNSTGFWKTLLNVIIIIFLIIAFPIIAALGLALVCCLLALIAFGSIAFEGSSALLGALVEEGMTLNFVTYSVLTAIGVILILGVPIFALIRLSIYKNRGSLSNGWKWSLIAAWIIGFLLTGIFLPLMLSDKYITEMNKDENIRIEEYYDPADPAEEIVNLKDKEKIKRRIKEKLGNGATIIIKDASNSDSLGNGTSSITLSPDSVVIKAAAPDNK